MNVSYYNDVTMSAMASQITSSFIVCSTVCSGADQRKHQSSVPLAFVKGIHRWPVDSPHKGPVTRKMFLFDDVIMLLFQGLFNAAYIWYKNYTHGWRFIALNVGLYRSIYPYISGLLHWQWGKHMSACEANLTNLGKRIWIDNIDIKPQQTNAELNSVHV